MKKAYARPEIVELPGRPREVVEMNVRVVVCERIETLSLFESLSGRIVAGERKSDNIEIPVAEELVGRRRALEGYFLKFWGAGAHFNGSQVQHSCPMVLWAHPGIPVLHWVARIAQMDSRGAPPSGTLRLVTNPDEPGTIQGGLSALESSGYVDLSQLGLPDRLGGWTVGGQRGVLVQGEGLLGLRLQAVARNVRVLWSAVSQAHPE